ncbi:hypothetical protein J4437_04290 [Candidatus Woesearchaeota archaeon]|nr:hypothetical protein [Candidatus Woesearchaeota archaeon]
MVNLFRKALIAGGLVGLLGCGPSEDEQLIYDVCEKYWLTCEGEHSSRSEFPLGNYSFGENYDDCMERGPTFMEAVRTVPGATQNEREIVLNILNCVAYESTCVGLDDDSCHAGEWDYYCLLTPESSDCFEGRK